MEITYNLFLIIDILVIMIFIIICPDFKACRSQIPARDDSKRDASQSVRFFVFRSKEVNLFCFSFAVFFVWFFLCFTAD